MNKTILYASDLDQTLIFSKNYLSRYPVQDNLICVERRDDEELTYMCKAVRDALALIASNSNVIFVPVTTRDMLHFKRVNLCKFTQPEYAIISNGSIILHNGVVMSEWTKRVASQLNAYEFDSVEKYCLNLFKTRCTPINLVDSALLMFKVEDADEFDRALGTIKDAFKQWQFIRQGHKCYAIPDCITKGAALHWLASKLKIGHVVATGDGPLDASMLDIADTAIVPDTSELSAANYNVARGGASSAIDTISFIKTRLLA